MTTHTEQIDGYGRFPMRRMIVLFFVGAALASGIYVSRGGSPTTTTATEAPSAAVTDGEPLVTGTDEPEALAPFHRPGNDGYAKRLLAEGACTNGTVTELYSRGESRGWSCVKNFTPTETGQ